MAGPSSTQTPTPSSSRRPEIKVSGTSRNPEYNIASLEQRFVRNADGRRVAPVSQLNTLTGRKLAEQQFKGVPSYTEGLRLPLKRTTKGGRKKGAYLPPSPAPSPSPSTSLRAKTHVSATSSGTSTLPIERQNCQEHPIRRVDGLKLAQGELRHKISDRDLLTSQRPRTELSQLLGLTRHSPSKRKGTTLKDIVTMAPITTAKKTSSSGSSRKSRSARKSSSPHIQLAQEKHLSSHTKGKPLPSLPPKPCLECGQSETTSAAQATITRISKIICHTCHRFIPAGKITALKTLSSSPRNSAQHNSSSLPNSNSESKHPLPDLPPPPPSKPPTLPPCSTCLAIPGYLLLEYARFFPSCTVCGHMSDQMVRELIENEGEVRDLTDDYGKRICGAGKELQDWCVFVAFTSKKAMMLKGEGGLKNKESFASLVSNGSGKGLKRKGAVKKAGRLGLKRGGSASTVSSAASGARAAVREEGLIPIALLREGGLETEGQYPYDRKFSFDVVGETLIPTYDTVAIASANVEAKEGYRLPTFSGSRKSSVEKKKMEDESETASLSSKDSQDTVELEYPAVISAMEKMAGKADTGASVKRADSKMEKEGEGGDVEAFIPPKVKRTFSEILGVKTGERTWDEEC